MNDLPMVLYPHSFSQLNLTAVSEMDARKFWAGAAKRRLVPNEPLRIPLLPRRPGCGSGRKGATSQHTGVEQIIVLLWETPPSPSLLPARSGSQIAPLDNISATALLWITLSWSRDPRCAGPPFAVPGYATTDSFTPLFPLRYAPASYI
jgi:hypothetical protein